MQSALGKSFKGVNFENLGRVSPAPFSSFGCHQNDVHGGRAYPQTANDTTPQIVAFPIFDFVLSFVLYIRGPARIMAIASPLKSPLKAS
jgi:hypothetical protein